ncbi:NAD(P)-binding protein [Corynespora cassiicola Philippines]|uniref:NAD(P)-binding protein n=1 Tax=Corynespora cassiicola Philippines TaxID=1448308 RepID=A0A2T2NAE7_CORCC|nr:NAD(P)-binding protein [Corynespora cassiicola Philippines]
MTKSILVKGATGKQGGTVIDDLLKYPADFIILVIRLTQEDVDDLSSIFVNAIKISSQPIRGIYIDRGGDTSFDNPIPVPYFTSKQKMKNYLVEKISTGQMNWIILRPAIFLDNYVPGFKGKVFFTAWKVALKNRPLQVVYVSDIGLFAEEAFESLGNYKGRSISITGDGLTFNEAAKIFKEKGKIIPATFGCVASLVLRSAKKNVSLMFKLIDRDGFGVNIQELKQLHPGPVDFRTNIRTQSGFFT